MASGGDSYGYPPVTLLEENLQDNYIEAGAELRSTAQRLPTGGLRRPSSGR